jgi:hypothetical protein
MDQSQLANWTIVIGVGNRHCYRAASCRLTTVLMMFEGMLEMNSRMPSRANPHPMRKSAKQYGDQPVMSLSMHDGNI